MAILGNIKIMMLKGEKGDQGEGVYDDSEVRQLIADETAEREENIAELERKFLEYLYPVGSIYMSVNTTSPAVLFGGTWEQIEGKFLLASSSNHALGSTGGEEEVALEYIEQIPRHGHQIEHAIYMSDDFIPNSYYQSDAGNFIYVGKYPHQDSTMATGGDADLDYDTRPHNNMPPYLTVNVWKRTA